MNPSETLQWLLTNVPEDTIEEHGQDIAEAATKAAQLEEENEALLSGIRNARHCLTHGRNTTPTEGERFDIGTTYSLLCKLLGEPWDALPKAKEK